MTSSYRGVRVLTDSAAALDPQFAAAHSVRVVQLTVEVGGRSLADAEASEALADPAAGAVHTSAPSPGRFLSAATDPPAPAGVVIVTVAASLSASHRAALLAARMSARSGGPPVEVVDSRSAAGGQALVTLAAARAAASGQPAAAVAAAAREAADGVRLLGTVGSVDALVRGGRLPAPAAAVGRLTGVQPLFELRLGRVRPLRPAFSRAAALDRIAGALRRDRRADAVAEVALSHAGAALDAEELLARVTREVSPAVVTVGGLGAAMLAHAGAGTLGLSWRWRREP